MSEIGCIEGDWPMVRVTTLMRLTPDTPGAPWHSPDGEQFGDQGWCAEALHSALGGTVQVEVTRLPDKHAYRLIAQGPRGRATVEVNLLATGHGFWTVARRSLEERR